ncbi:hypothetical protein Pmani_036255 [Petrolisthes manimaculis]|uniref:Uncharacterized protein n=1 Tax=Petrolisthes manimaculis TaxID=1843537 RepID=A0AAE1TMV1_9EUCA|nr:hypothetical protein Pmani_036255 [Petrolisthes manimaculis]
MRSTNLTKTHNCNTPFISPHSVFPKLATPTCQSFLSVTPSDSTQHQHILTIILREVRRGHTYRHLVQDVTSSTNNPQDYQHDRQLHPRKCPIVKGLDPTGGFCSGGVGVCTSWCGRIP